jgi:hypothetical protein
MGTTARGISYPDPAGVPSRSALQTLAQTADAAIGAAVTDTGWQTMTLSLGVGTARYRAVTLGSAVLVCVELSVSGLSPAAGADTTIVSAANGIPTAYRPGITTYIATRVTAGGVIGLAYAHIDGSIHIQDVTAGGLAQGVATYFAG